METQFSFFSFLFTVILVIIFSSKLRKKPNKTQNLPPGPWKLPLIGSFHHLIGALPHHKFRDLAKKYGPIMHLQLGANSNIVISSPEIAKEIMKTHDLTFADRPFVPSASLATYNSTNIAFSPYGDYWRQLRKICMTELLSAPRVKSFSSIRQEQTSRLMRSISSSAGSPINFSRMIESFMYSIISKAAFGKIWKGEEVLVPNIRKLTYATLGFNIVDIYPSNKFIRAISTVLPKVKQLHQAVDEIFQNLIDEHLARRAADSKPTGAGGEGEEEDLADVLLSLQSKGDLEFPLTTENIKAVILDMFIAGSDTSSTPLEWAMAEMVKNPRVMKKAQEEVRRVFNAKGDVDEGGLDELNYLKLVIKETLRLHPPVPLLVPRECRESCVINGYDIPHKTRVIVNAWAIGRNPNYWTEPEKFYPERFLNSSIDYKGVNFEFIPFGAGRRICPGILFGMANVELPLAHLLYHFDWKLPSGLKPENLDMTESLSVTVKRKNALCLIPIPLPSSTCHVKP